MEPASKTKWNEHHAYRFYQRTDQGMKRTKKMLQTKKWEWAEQNKLYRK